MDEKDCAKITLELLYIIRREYLSGMTAESLIKRCLEIIPILEEIASDRKTLN